LASRVEIDAGATEKSLEMALPELEVTGGIRSEAGIVGSAPRHGQ
jgi:hypothetical protein